jgi:hypothetical protein
MHQQKQPNIPRISVVCAVFCVQLNVDNNDEWGCLYEITELCCKNVDQHQFARQHD